MGSCDIFHCSKVGDVTWIHKDALWRTDTFSVMQFSETVFWFLLKVANGSDFVLNTKKTSAKPMMC